MATVETLVNSPEHHFSGYLKRKRKLKLTVWSSCYVVLTRNALYIFNSYSPLRTYDFKTSLLLYDRVQIRASRSRNHAFMLVPLMSSCPKLVFGCLAPSERLRWMEALRYAMMWAHNKFPTSQPMPPWDHQPSALGLPGLPEDIVNVYDDLEERQEMIDRVEQMNLHELIDMSDSGSINNSGNDNSAGSICLSPPSQVKKTGDASVVPYSVGFCSDSEFESEDEEEKVQRSSILPLSAPVGTGPVSSTTCADDVTPSAPSLNYEYLLDIRQPPCAFFSASNGALSGSSEDSSKQYYQKCMFYGSREAAFDVMRTLHEDGVFMVRVDQGRAVLTVRDGTHLIKYRLDEKPDTGQVSIEKTELWFDTLPHLLHHYHFQELPNRKVKLIEPYEMALNHLYGNGK